MWRIGIELSFPVCVSGIEPWRLHRFGPDQVVTVSDFVASCAHRSVGVDGMVMFSSLVDIVMKQ